MKIIKEKILEFSYHLIILFILFFVSNINIPTTFFVLGITSLFFCFVDTKIMSHWKQTVTPDKTDYLNVISLHKKHVQILVLFTFIVSAMVVYLNLNMLNFSNILLIFPMICQSVSVFGMLFVTSHFIDELNPNTQNLKVKLNSY